MIIDREELNRTKGHMEFEEIPNCELNDETLMLVLQVILNSEENEEENINGSEENVS